MDAFGIELNMVSLSLLVLFVPTFFFVSATKRDRYQRAYGSGVFHCGSESQRMGILYLIATTLYFCRKAVMSGC